MDRYESLVNDPNDFEDVVRILIEEGIEELMDEAGASWARDMISGRNFATPSVIEKKKSAFQSWFDQIASSNRMLALHGLVLAESASVAHIPIPDSVLFDRNRRLEGAPMITNWALLCKFMGRSKVASPRQTVDRFKHRRTEAYHFLRRFSGTYLAPGPRAEEYIRVNDCLVYDEPTEYDFMSLSHTTHWAIVTPETGAPANCITLSLKARNGYHFLANYSLATRTLSITSPLLSLRPQFRRYDTEDVYDFLVETAEELIRSAILDEALVFTSPVALIADATEEEENTGAIEATTTDIEEVTAPPQGTLSRDEPKSEQGGQQSSPYLRSLTHREAVNAFVRIGAIVINSHHTMISYNGVTARFANFHQTDTHILRKSAKKACRVLGIPWADFVAAVH